MMKRIAIAAAIALAAYGMLVPKVGASPLDNRVADLEAKVEAMYYDGKPMAPPTAKEVAERKAMMEWVKSIKIGDDRNPVCANPMTDELAKAWGC